MPALGKEFGQNVAGEYDDVEKPLKTLSLKLFRQPAKNTRSRFRKLFQEWLVGAGVGQAFFWRAR